MGRPSPGDPSAWPGYRRGPGRCRRSRRPERLAHFTVNVATGDADIAQRGVAQTLQFVARPRPALPFGETALNRSASGIRDACGNVSLWMVLMARSVSGNQSSGKISAVCGAGCDGQHSLALSDKPLKCIYFLLLREAYMRACRARAVLAGAINRCAIQAAAAAKRPRFRTSASPAPATAPPCPVVTDGAKQPGRRTHRDRKPRIGIEHRLAHPAETRRRQRRRPSLSSDSRRARL